MDGRLLSHQALRTSVAVPLSEPNSVFFILPGWEKKTRENMCGLYVYRFLHLVVLFGRP